VLQIVFMFEGVFSFRPFRQEGVSRGAPRPQAPRALHFFLQGTGEGIMEASKGCPPSGNENCEDRLRILVSQRVRLKDGEAGCCKKIKLG